jgi:hypothetical protein
MKKIQVLNHEENSGLQPLKKLGLQPWKKIQGFNHLENPGLQPLKNPGP